MYDSIIIGGGPAGLTAAIYLGRAKRKAVVIEKIFAGGQAGVLPVIENYPGYENVSGYELIKKMTAQAKCFGAEFISGEATRIEKTADGYAVRLSDGKTLDGETVVIASGCKAKGLGLAGEEALLGAGVSYCATCDGNFFRGRTVAVAGFGEKAREAAEYLAGLAAKTYLITTDDEEAAGAEKIRGRVTALVGKPLRAVEVACGDEKIALDVAGLFISAGYTPVTHYAAGLANLDERGYAITDENMRAGADGIYAVGDARKKGLRQIVTAVSDGAIAAGAIIRYIAGKKRR